MDGTAPIAWEERPPRATRAAPRASMRHSAAEAPECRSSSEAVVLTEFAGVGDWSSLSSPLLGLAESEKRLRIDAVVLHGVRGGVALHDLLEGLDVGDLGDERGLPGPVCIPERPNGDAHRPEHFFSLRRAQPMLDLVHF